MKKVPIGAKLKSLRQSSGQSAKAVSRQLGVAESTYRDWEYGRAIKGEPYAALAKIFDITLSELLCQDLDNERRHILEGLKRIEILIKDIKSVL